MGLVRADESATGAVGAALRVSPLGVTLTLSTDHTSVGRTIRARASVTNLGGSAISGVTVELRADQGGLDVAAPVITIGRIRPGQTASVSWSVCARVAGQYLVLARATFEGATVESMTRLLTVTGTVRKTCR